MATLMRKGPVTKINDSFGWLKGILDGGLNYYLKIKKKKPPHLPATEKKSHYILLN